MDTFETDWPWHPKGSLKVGMIVTYYHAGKQQRGRIIKVRKGYDTTTFVDIVGRYSHLVGIPERLVYPIYNSKLDYLLGVSGGPI